MPPKRRLTVRDALRSRCCVKSGSSNTMVGVTHPRWRHEPDVPPAAQLIHSPYDLEARYSIQARERLGGLQGPCDGDV